MGLFYFGDMDWLYKVYRQSTGISTDTRTISTGNLFFALSGERFDANAFIGQALDKGAIGVVCSKEPEGRDDRVYVVSDVLRSLQNLASWHRAQLDYPIIALTGSNGKTTTKEAMRVALSAGMKVQCTQGNLNNHIGVPLTLLSLKDDLDAAIIEMGANHQKEIAHLCDITQPDIGMITNIGMAHIEGFGGLMGVRKGKGEMYDHLKAKDKTILYNADERFLKDMVNGHEPSIAYSDKGVVVNSEEYGFKKLSARNTGLVVSHEGDEYTIQTRLVGEYNFRNLLPGIVLGLYFNIPLEAICSALNGLYLGMNRSQEKKVGGLVFVLDAYNANPTSMDHALSSFEKRADEDKVVVLGEMMELGNETEYQHQIVLDRLGRMKDLKMAILVGKAFQLFKDKYPFHFFNDIEEASSWWVNHRPNNGCVLLKGSRSNCLEKLEDSLGE
jgi:UDP-N-acetylmuramoyl-tripeptide--D-alanyl-D-alanine ligase